MLKTMRNRVAVILAALLLAACGGQNTVAEMEIVENRTTQWVGGFYVQAFEVTLPSGRTVECVSLAESLSCDWLRRG